MGRLTATVLALVSACRYGGTFVCDTDEDCRARGSVGRCQLENGFCLFNDETCPSGFRYADSAGDELANSCASEPSPADAAVVDARPFDPTTCPAQYTGTLAGVPNAKYVQLPNGGNQPFLQQIARCEQGLAGATHAIVVDSTEKAAALATFIGSTSRVWVGLIQSPNATDVGGDWIVFTGESVLASLWAASDTEPDDEDMIEGDHAEQAGAFGAMGFYDQPIGLSYPVVCECDGRATSATAMQYLTGQAP